MYWVIFMLSLQLLFKWIKGAFQIGSIILKQSTSMKSPQIASVTKDTPDAQLRRSTRQKKEPKNDDYFMGRIEIDDIIGDGDYEEDCYPKRKRKSYRFDDSDDYFEGPRNFKKGKHINANKVEALLEWRNQLESLPVTINYHQGQTVQIQLDQLHKVKFSKAIALQNLAAIKENIEALLINIDWDKKGQTLKDFQMLKIDSSKLMAKGLAFVWAPKVYVSELLSIMEKKDFTYVQNLQIINFDIEKAKAFCPTYKANAVKRHSKLQEVNINQNQIDLNYIISSLTNIDPCELIAEQPSKYFNVSKRTLLMFKKNTNLKMELRHQRTCDVVFDMPSKLGAKCEPQVKAYIYNMIQTLLPDCLTIDHFKKNQLQFKMMQLWADVDQYRRGWISVVQE